jgi:SAM-dependent methyltransferase
VSSLASPVELYSVALARQRPPDGLTVAEALFLRAEDGTRTSLPLARWLGPLDDTDGRVLDRARGPVLDVGCGPGRHLLALARRGVPALGVDIAAAAVRRARDRGTAALAASVFDPLPHPGSWRTALLLDGNIGIGGSAVALLRRLRELLDGDGLVLCELDPPGAASRCELVALEDGEGLRSRWFAWARVSVDGIGPAAARAGFDVAQVWHDGGRWFGALEVA